MASQNPKELLIACMDGRLDAELLSMSNENTLLIRNAGANVSTLHDSIAKVLEENQVERITIVTHVAGKEKGTGCGAMGIVKGAMEDDKLAKELATETLMRPFKGIAPSEVERLNCNVQEKELREFLEKKGFGNIAIETMSIVIESKPHESRVAVLVTNPSFRDYSRIAKELNFDLSAVYFIQAPVLKDVESDIKIVSKALGIKRIVLPTDGANPENMLAQQTRLIAALTGNQPEVLNLKSAAHRLKL